MMYYLELEPLQQMFNEKLLNNVSATLKKNMLDESERTLTFSTYEKEIQLYKYVEQGDVDGLINFYNNTIRSNVRTRFHVHDKLLQARYSAVCTLVLLARVGIKGGMFENESYCLSDIYIQKSAEINDYNEIMQLVPTAFLDYTIRVNRIRKIPRYSRVVSFCCNYIEEHIHTNITLDELSKACNLSKEYLSRIFKKEAGFTIKQYALNKKLDAAAYLLINTNKSVQDISAFLGFSSHGRFSGYFYVKYGVRPKEYRTGN